MPPIIGPYFVPMTIQLQFLGAVGTVTGSQFLVTTDAHRILVDCGMFQGSPEEVSRNRMPFAFEPAGIDALLLTHAHLDHCGRIPALVHAGYHGPVIATGGTVDLAEIVLRDSAKLQEEAENRWRRRHPDAAGTHDAEVADDESMPDQMRKAPPEGKTHTRTALYRMADVDQTVRQFRSVEYGKVIEIVPGITAIFHDAGHILGSAIIELRLHDGEADHHRRLLRRPRAQRHADLARPHPALPCGLRAGGVDLWQPRTRRSRSRRQ